MSLSRAQNIFMPANINSIVILSWVSSFDDSIKSVVDLEISLLVAQMFLTASTEYTFSDNKILLYWKGNYFSFKVDIQLYY